LFLLLQACFGLQLNAQQQVLVSELHPELKYYPLKGKVYYQDYIQVKGSAFLTGEDWINGDIFLTSGKRLNNIKYKIDIYAHRILAYQPYLKRIVLVSKEDISTCLIKDTDPPRKFIFLSNIPTKAKVSDGCYFEVLSEGRISFYKLFYKDVLPLRSPEMPLLDEFLDETTYFLKDGDAVRSVRLRKNVLFKMYPEYKSELKDFIRRKNLHLRQEDDFNIAVSHLGSVLELIENTQ
jgi:hypothetical protein